MPVLSESRWANSSACSSIRSAIRHMILARSRPGSWDQTPDSKDAFARATASSTASSPQSVNSVICSSVAGSMTEMTSPEPGSLTDVVQYFLQRHLIPSVPSSSNLAPDAPGDAEHLLSIADAARSRRLSVPSG